jgi:hypothetical protein
MEKSNSHQPALQLEFNIENNCWGSKWRNWIMIWIGSSIVK